MGVARVRDAAHDLGDYIRSQREAAQVSLRQLSKIAGVSNPYLSQIERGLRHPSAEVLSQIAKGLRLSSEALYVRAGYLDEIPQPSVRDAIAADDRLTELQRNQLLETYESFVRASDSEEE